MEADIDQELYEAAIREKLEKSPLKIFQDSKKESNASGEVAPPRSGSQRGNVGNKEIAEDTFNSRLKDNILADLEF